MTWQERFDKQFDKLNWLSNDNKPEESLGDILKCFIQQEIDKAREEAYYKGARNASPEEIQIRRLERDRILKLIEPYIENCKKAIAEGGMHQFGSASGGMMAKSALEAFEELKNKINDQS